MKRDVLEYFNKYTGIDTYFIAESEYHEPFWEFMYRFQALQRNWVFTIELSKKHIEILRKAEQIKGQSQEYYDYYSETAGADINYIPEQSRGATLSILLSLFENLLTEVSYSVAAELNIEIEIPEKKMPIISKHIYWLTKACGLEIEITSDDHKKLDAIRAVRNRFIHNISRDLPENIKKTLSKIVKANDFDKIEIDDAFVDFSFKEIAILVKHIELKYIEFYRNSMKKNILKQLDIPENLW
jgi:hypothetical protein